MLGHNTWRQAIWRLPSPIKMRGPLVSPIVEIMVSELASLASARVQNFHDHLSLSFSSTWNLGFVLEGVRQANRRGAWD